MQEPTKPKSICFVPEKRQEITTEGGLDVIKNFDNLQKNIKILSDSNINISIFIDPDKDQLIATHKLGIKTIEFHTGIYANAFIQKRSIPKTFFVFLLNYLPRVRQCYKFLGCILYKGQLC